MILLDQYLDIKKQIHAYFGYKEDWRIIPIDDAREYVWKIVGGEGRGGEVCFADTSEKLNGDGDYYSNVIYTQRHLPKWVYRGPEFTMICVDTQTDFNVLLQIFDNAKEVKD